MIKKREKTTPYWMKTFCIIFVNCLLLNTVLVSSESVEISLSASPDEKLAEAQKAKEIDTTLENINNRTRPSVPKCCNITYGFTFDNKSLCVQTEDEFLPEFEDWADYIEVAQELPVETRYEYFIGDPCWDGKYILDLSTYPDDKYLVYTNGTLLYLDQLYSKEEFCLETLNGTIRAFICFGTKSPEYKLNFTFVLYAIGLLISIPFLLATAAVYLWIDLFRDLHGKSLSCHVLCLAIGYLALAVVQLASDQLDENLCIAAGFIIQFFFVASFFWLNVICYDTWRCINNDFRCVLQPRNLRSEKVIFYAYSAYGWNGPIFISIVTLIMDLEPAIPESYLKPNFGLRSCWFYSDDAALPYFYGPVALVIVINIIFFFLSARKIYKEEKRREECKARNRLSTDETKEAYKSIQLYTKTLQECMYLFCIMGINWAAEVISWAVGGSQTIWLITDVFNAFQGVMIFYLFVIKPEMVRKIVKKRLSKAWKKIMKCDCGHKEEKKRVSRHWHANCNYYMEEADSNDENEICMSPLNPAAV